MLFARFLLAGVWDQSLSGPSTEWVRGEKLCTFRGKYHLAWSIPMADPTYVIPSLGLHFFLLFAPSFALYENTNHKWKVIRTIFVFVTGPFLAGWITSDLMEQGSIWCFFSIAQIAIMVYSDRKRLLLGTKTT